MHRIAGFENNVFYTGPLSVLDSKNDRKVEENFRRRHSASLFRAVADFRSGTEHGMTVFAGLLANRLLAGPKRSDRWVLYVRNSAYLIPGAAPGAMVKNSQR